MRIARWELGASGLLLCAALACGVHADAVDNLWRPADAGGLAGDDPRVLIRPSRFRVFSADPQALRGELQAAPLEFTQAAFANPLVFSVPMPDGSTARFQLVESPVMAAELAARYPQIRTFAGQGVDDPRATIRCDYTQNGFHAQILSPAGTVYVDPHRTGDQALHISYYKRDLANTHDFACLTETADALGLEPLRGPLTARTGEELRTYRLAVAATGEYTQFHGGTVALGMAAILTAINRVDGIYETELAIRMVLVANNDLVVYTNANTDPYTNNNGGAMLSENQANLDSVIGSANYDIGHAFSTGGGGIARLRSVCSISSKAQGVTGLSSPIGDAFYVDFVAHEMGHQFGGNHPFNGVNGNCAGGNRNGSTAYEPGSGSTIMAYAGICGADNLQSHSDPFFSFISLQEITANVTTGSGSGCATVSATGNSPPTIDAGPDFVVPAGTPFELNATGGDPDEDPLTYSWEEADLGAAQALAEADNGSSPLFRARRPKVISERVFPRRSDLRANTLAPGEKLPTTDRTMTFRVTARDNRVGGGGYALDTMQLTVTTAAGPFRVLSPNGGETWGGARTILWDVAGTNAAGVNASTVDILLSTDDGRNFDTLLAAGTANDGVEVVVLPNLTTDQARIEVHPTGNVFFDFSDGPFSIEPTALSITLPNGAPDTLQPGVPTRIDVLVVPGTENVVAGSPTLHYSPDGVAFQTTPLLALGGDAYQATLPAAFCADTPAFYFSAAGDGGATVTEPSGAPASVFSPTLGSAVEVFVDDFELDNGWSVSGNATDGQWQRGVPVVCNRGDPPADSDGSGACYLTDNSAAGTCNSDVDGGTTSLTSPAFDMTSGGTISYAYWLNDVPGGALGVEDGLAVEIATNAAGTNWTMLRNYGSAAAAWRFDAIEVGVEVPASATLRIRFSASDNAPGDVVEAGVDDVRVSVFECVDPTPCVGDLNGDRVVDLADLAVLLANFGTPAGTLPADGDLDADGDVDLADLAVMLSAFGTACT